MDTGLLGSVFVVAELEQAGFGDSCSISNNNLNPRASPPGHRSETLIRRPPLTLVAEERSPETTADEALGGSSTPRRKHHCHPAGEQRDADGLGDQVHSAAIEARPGRYRESSIVERIVNQPR